ncbi:MAG: methyltransferase domain-containing protein [Pseudolabrys sp.]
MEKAPATYRKIWDRKPVLRAVYGDIYRHMLKHVVPGPILEVGGGSGNFKLFAPHTVSSDILPAPWLDLACDAQALPFSDNSFANIVMVDALHHIANPLRFLTEAARVLRPGGRLIACEPAITPLSGLFYRLFHDEPVDMSAHPLEADSASDARGPYDSNQAVPTLLVGRFREACRRAVPNLELEQVEYFSFVAYPLSGGFRTWSLMPAIAVRLLLAAEWKLRHMFGPLAAFRLIAVYRRI